MKDKRRLLLGIPFFALMFFYVGVRIYFTFIQVGSYDGWSGNQKGPDGAIYVISVDPKGPATALQVGDEFLAVNGTTIAQDPDVINFNYQVPPGTRYTVTVRRNGQELVIPITTTKRNIDFGQKAFVPVGLIFLVTGLAVFLLRPDNQQAWLLALMLGTFSGLSSWYMPLGTLGRWVEFVTAFAKILCLWALPFFVRFFLNFPERSPILRRWPKLERFINWPFYLTVLPILGGGRLPAGLRAWYFTLPPIKWLSVHGGIGTAILVVVGYLAAGLVCLVVNYSVADRNARRRLRVVMAGSGVGFLTFLLLVFTEYLRNQGRIQGSTRWLEICAVISLPFIPLSFAYAIIRHKVIPIRLIIRRSARYLLVSHGSAVLVVGGVVVFMVLVIETFIRYVYPLDAIMQVVVYIVLSIVASNLAHSFHKGVIAPMIDRRFFRESYDARQILAELSHSVRSITDNKQLLELVCTRIQKALHIESVTVFLRDETSGDYATAVSFDYLPNGNCDIAGKNGARLHRDAEVIRLLSESDEPLNADLRDPKSPLHRQLPAAGNGSPPAERAVLEGLNTALLLPLAAKDRLLGLISLGPRLGDLPFSHEDEQMLMSVAGQTTFAIENIRLIESMIEEKRRMQELEAENERRARELEEARQLQLSMLPKRVPQLPDLEIAAYMKTATQVGGDYYDFHLGDDGTLTVAVGDATGHGLKASTMVTAAKSLFGAFAIQPDPTQIFQQTSRVLKRMNLRSLFMAMTIIKVKGRQLTVSSAGMPPLLIYRASSGAVEEIAIRGMPLGSITNYPYRQQVVTIGAGDVLALMSDGLPERFNTDNEMLDYQPIKQAFATVADRSPQAIIDHLVHTGEAWAGGRPQDDDVTFVVLKVTCP